MALTTANIPEQEKGLYPQRELTVLLADDDKDDRFLFGKAIAKLDHNIALHVVNNGEQLMKYLLTDGVVVPDVVFLDLNMPRKNGAECLQLIKSHEKLKGVEVIIYSTSLRETVADVLYNNGAYYYLQKCTFSDLVRYLQLIFNAIRHKEQRPGRAGFMLNGE